MADFLCSPRTLNALKSSAITSYNSVGLLMDGRCLTAYDAAKIAYAKMEMTYNGIWGFYVPWSMLSGMCGATAKCRDVFSAFFVKVMTEIAGDYKKPVFITLAMPHRDIWQRDREQYVKFLDDVLSKKNPNVYPSITTLPHVFLKHKKVKESTLLLSIEPNWTEFVKLSDNHITFHTAAAFGYQSDPAQHRINDYIYNSSAEWRDFSARSWEDGLKTILENVLNQKECHGIARIQYVCLSGKQIITNTLQHLTVNGILSERWDAADSVAEVAKKEFQSLCVSKREPRKDASANKNDPFKW